MVLLRSLRDILNLFYNSSFETPSGGPEKVVRCEPFSAHSLESIKSKPDIQSIHLLYSIPYIQPIRRRHGPAPIPARRPKPTFHKPCVIWFRSNLSSGVSENPTAAHPLYKLT
ncbi:uncharacterized protein BDR25DRAFT_383977 [Lindgomyces ingoldianus]|uniref:Uncharacterized protein n=1 Tax=Lindgomyces ingoldianus TaxID=673940 RepID=A0ACB6R6D8_9PLEO|nr:uncharacterized protein BDR25DRAFT_383977 [Lindgomyces ingoldianus]KAF2474630.1 hypothetical protein BDR25DRAFT_383977 [Lindgomyces ingoldianus]